MPDTEALRRKLDVDKLVAGDEDEFELLVRNESERLFRVIRRFVGDEDEARSVMQEAFLQAFERRETFRRESKFTTWLYAIGINLARASVRKASRIASLSEADFDRLQPEFSPAGFPVSSVARWNPEKFVEDGERRVLVHRAISRLPEDYRVIVTLRDIEELPTQEVAEILQISEGAARVRLHRARTALRGLLTEYFADPGNAS